MKPFARFLLALAILLGCCAVADVGIGFALDRMLDEVPNNGNETGAAHYAIKEVTDPVLIVGSSRAKYHYYPDIIADSLGMKVYNAGRGGYYLSYHCCLINMILDRYTPDILIWEFSLDALFAGGDDIVNKFRPYYWDYDEVREVIDEKEGNISRIKNLSNAYRYNGMAVPIIYRWLAGGPDSDPLNGMAPIPNTGKGLDPEVPINRGLTGPLDTARVARLKQTLKRLSDAGVKVFVFDSPNFAHKDPNRDKASESIIFEECAKYSFPVFDNREIEFFLHHPEMFYDEGHLFDDGAMIYSRIAAHQLVQELKKESYSGNGAE